MAHRPQKSRVRAGRILHWVLALPYLSLLGTGGGLVLARTFGIRAGWLGALHKASGTCLAAGLVSALLLSDTGGLLRRCRSVAARRPSRPQQGFPRSGLHLLAQLLLVPTAVGSGLLLWLYDSFSQARTVHLACFAVATPLVLSHLFVVLSRRLCRRTQLVSVLAIVAAVVAVTSAAWPETGTARPRRSPHPETARFQDCSRCHRPAVFSSVQEAH